ncbi:HIT family protein [Corynebacterium kalidii]|uniref:HIT domain-containing protein n=1 Tax=Corynebacterium kalidii TaxID=2931982 RepID=A0A9X1WJA2_9CORY|nr:HIT domain-containing protein [Corynebacterium kalidii]MCJ7859596.1 HIT domain-containing protein [Corynebacterium kalidii]
MANSADVSPDGLARLWAPYRSAYLGEQGADGGSSGGGDTDPDDPFLALPGKSDEEALIVARGDEVFCILNLYPYNPGHMMVLPYRKVASYEDLTESETRELAEFTKKAIRTLRAVSGPDALNVGMNLGRASGGSVPGHLHQHIVPRWQGDTSFMTVLSGSKVLIQLLGETRELLATAWQQLD